MLCLTGSKQDVIQANAQIESNCGIPCPGTERWSEVVPIYEMDVYFIIAPPEMGWNQCSYEQMMYNVVNVEIQESDPSWFPPSSPGPS